MSFALDGVSCELYGIRVEYYPDTIVASRDVSRLDIPGRIGSIIQDNGGYLNYTQPYSIAIGGGKGLPSASVMSRRAAAWLTNHADDYYELTDTYDGDTIYRMARFIGPFDAENILNRAGRCTIYFDVKPQRYFTTGKNKVRLLTVVGGGVDKITGDKLTDTSKRRTGRIPVSYGDSWTMLSQTEGAAVFFDEGYNHVDYQTITAGKYGDISVPYGADNMMLTWGVGGYPTISCGGIEANYTDLGPILSYAQGLPSRPLVIMQGNALSDVPLFGGFKIGSRQLTITSFYSTGNPAGPVYVDCEDMTSYYVPGGVKKSLNRFTRVTDELLGGATADGYPIMEADEEGNIYINTAENNPGISAETPVWALDIYPRWWSL